MRLPRLPRLARLYCLAAGACDTITGLLLVIAPAWTLALMGVDDALAQPVWMRFIGAFVLGVGALYLVGLAREPRGGARLAHFMEATMLVRIVIAAFTGAAVAMSALSTAWLSVCLTDASFAALQAFLLRRGAFLREE